MIGIQISGTESRIEQILIPDIHRHKQYSSNSLIFCLHPQEVRPGGGSSTSGSRASPGSGGGGDTSRGSSSPRGGGDTSRSSSSPRAGGDNSSDDTGYISHNSLVELRRTQLEIVGNGVATATVKAPPAAIPTVVPTTERWDYNTALNKFRKEKDKQDDIKVGFNLKNNLIEIKLR